MSSSGRKRLKDFSKLTYSKQAHHSKVHKFDNVQSLQEKHDLESMWLPIMLVSQRWQHYKDQMIYVAHHGDTLHHLVDISQ